jgi:deoxyribonuclease IV
MTYPRIGFHVSISRGISNSVDNALNIDCNAFQIFSRNPRGWTAKPLQDDDVENFRQKVNNSKIDRDSIFVHMPYLPNLSSSERELHKKSTDTLMEEIRRCDALGIRYVILHLGKHGAKGKEHGINQLVKACNFAIDNYYSKRLPAIIAKRKKKNNGSEYDKSINIVLENSAGGKNSIGSKFDELGLILDKLESSSRTISFSICLDTCHAFAAGYDLRTGEGVNETLDKFRSEIGLSYLKVIHLNDSKHALNSNRDRHEHIGLGKIGKEGFRELLRHKTIRKLPIIMETPIDRRRDDPGNLKVVMDLLTNKKRRKE